MKTFRGLQKEANRHHIRVHNKCHWMVTSVLILMMIMMTLKKLKLLVVPWEGTKQKQEEMMAQMTQLNTTLAKHMAETVRITVNPLLMPDVRHLDPEDQETEKAVKTSIREK
ncbi:unnamed protein product [Lactuca virosa]|uniref:Uncharacterized protein n=1 Tax=Lactuca virosa TaxID=75947 RepID=A0AAU9PJT1_9ASTR|nr:unnamed protein product [Lactuca virosa]